MATCLRCQRVVRYPRRGLCVVCKKRYRRLVAMAAVTWEELEIAGLARAPRYLSAGKRAAQALAHPLPPPGVPAPRVLPQVPGPRRHRHGRGLAVQQALQAIAALEGTQSAQAEQSLNKDETELQPEGGAAHGV